MTEPTPPAFLVARSVSLDEEWHALSEKARTSKAHDLAVRAWWIGTGALCVVAFGVGTVFTAVTGLGEYLR